MAAIVSMERGLEAVFELDGAVAHLFSCMVDSPDPLRSELVRLLTVAVWTSEVGRQQVMRAPLLLFLLLLLVLFPLLLLLPPRL